MQHNKKDIHLSSSNYKTKTGFMPNSKFSNPWLSPVMTNNFPWLSMIILNDFQQLRILYKLGEFKFWNTCKQNVCIEKITRSWG